MPSRTVVVATFALFIAALLLWRQAANAIYDHFGVLGAIVAVSACGLIALYIDRDQRRES